LLTIDGRVTGWRRTAAGGGCGVVVVGVGVGVGAVCVPTGLAVVALDFVALRSPHPVARAVHRMRTAVDDLVRTAAFLHGSYMRLAPSIR